jgi:predicted small lipoprotein YifL
MLLVCSGCGFKGPLYLPERNATVVTHPRQGAPSSGQTQAPAAKEKGKIPPAPPPASSAPPPQ